MVFDNVSDLAKVKLDTWFRAGSLEVSKEAIYRDPLDRVCFEFNKTICSRKPLRCLPVFVPDDPKQHWDQLLYIKSMTNGVTTTTFTSRKELEEIFGTAKDPESLEDSDMDDFLGSSQGTIPHHKLNERISEICLHREYLLVSPNSIFKAGDAQQTLLDRSIIDCQVINTFPGKLGSMLLITTSAGYILSMLLDLQDKKPRILQYWKLRQNGSDWKIVVHQSNEHFVVVNESKGICKFFEFRDPLHFTLVNNLSIDNTFFLNCSFFLDTNHSTHCLLFVPSVRYHRMIFFCIEWDSNRSEMKEVHQLTYLEGYEVTSSIPVGHNLCLASSGPHHYLVSAHQIMSGESRFQHFESKFLEDPCSYFDAPLLLEKLKNSFGDLFDRFDKCTLLGSLSGNIGICLYGQNVEACFYSLTRFKGLKHICPVDYQETAEGEYEMIIISFGRTLRLTIDITSIQQLQDDIVVPPLNGILFKHTIDSSTEENSGLMVLSPPKKNSRFQSELWLTSNIAISHLQTFAPVRKLHDFCKLRQFQVFNRLKVFNCSAFNDNLRRTLLQGIEIDHDSEFYLIIASDLVSMSKAFLLNASSCLSTIELDDLLQNVAGDSIDIFFSSVGNMIQVTSDMVYVDSLGSCGDEKIEKHSPGWKIDGVAHCNNKMIIWNIDDSKVSYIADIDQLGKTTTFIESHYFNGIIEKTKKDCGDLNRDEKSFNFVVTQLDNGIVLVYLDCSFGLFKYSWDDLSLNVDNDGIGQLIISTQDSTLLASKNYIYVNEIGDRLIGANHKGSSPHLIETGYVNKDTQIRPFDDDSIIVFSPQEITVASISSSLESGEYDEIYELKLPFQNKPNPILDVYADPKRKRIFVLYSDGLQIFNLFYCTWNSSNYLLKGTRSLKRIFFISKINRMLVVNLSAKEWGCIKLVDGRSLSLDSKSLKIPENLKLIDVMEIPNERDNNVQLLLHFGSLIKLVRFVPMKGRIVVQELAQRDFSSEIFRRIEVGKDGSFVLYMPSTISSPKQKPSSKFVMLHVNELNELEEINELSFPDEIHLQDFKLCDNDVVVINKDYDRLFLFKDFARLANLKRPMAIAVKMPAASKIEKICSIGTDSFVVAVNCEGRSDHLSELLFCHRDDICLNISGDDEGFPKGGDNILYEAAVADDLERSHEDSIYEAAVADDLERSHEDSLVYYRPEVDPDTEINGARAEPYENWSFEDNTDTEYEESYADRHEEYSDTDQPMLDTDEMDEMDEIDAFDARPGDFDLPFNTDQYHPTQFQSPRMSEHPFSSSDLAEPILTSRFRKPYQVINLHKTIKDVKYDPSSSLFVLATDGSVLIFHHVLRNLQRDHNEICSSATHVLNKPAAAHVAPKTTESGICTINKDGHVKEWPWL